MLSIRIGCAASLLVPISVLWFAAGCQLLVQISHAASYAIMLPIMVISHAANYAISHTANFGD